MIAVTVRDLTVPGRLTGVSFALRAGTLTWVVGPNGAGKSTLLQAIAGLLPASGEIEWEGWPLSGIDSPLATAIRPMILRLGGGVLVAVNMHHLPSVGELTEGTVAAKWIRSHGTLASVPRERGMTCRFAGNTKPTQLRGSGKDQHGNNTDKTVLPGTGRHAC